VSALLNDASRCSPLGARLLAPGSQYGATGASKLDFLSLAISLMFGISCLPHVLMRFYTVPNAREARRSVVWCSGSMFVFYLAILVVGFGATALVGSNRILSSPGGVNSAAPLLAYQIGGTVLLGVVAAVAFATILAVVAGLTITASASFAHDVYANLIKRGEVGPGDEVRVAAAPRWWSVCWPTPVGCWPTARTWPSWCRGAGAGRVGEPVHPAVLAVLENGSPPPGRWPASTAG